MGKCFETVYEPQEGERDPVGGHYHSTYMHVRWGHDRYAFMEQIGFSNAELTKRQLTFAAVHQEGDFFAVVPKGDSVVVRTAIEKIGETSFIFSHEMCRKSDGTLAARGKAVTVVLSLETKGKAVVPGDLKKALEPFLPSTG